MPRLAAIDVGSNAVRSLLVDLSDTGRVVDSRFRRYPMPLGEDVFAAGRIAPGHSDRLVDVFREIGGALTERHVNRYRAVATAAMREAKNGAVVARRIIRESGIELEIIDGREESRLARDALLRAVGWAPRDALLADLGGGTLELVRARSRRGVSLPLGTVRMLHTSACLRAPIDARSLDALIAGAGAVLRRGTRMRRRASLMIGTGGNFNFLAAAIPSPGTAIAGIDVRRLRALAVRLAGMTVQQRVRGFRLRRDRAKLVVAAAIVILAVVRQFHVELIVVPGTGLRESILHTLNGRAEIRTRADDPLAPLGGNRRRAEGHARLAAELFDVTVPFHGLWEPGRAVLRAAAYLLETRGSPRTADALAPAGAATQVAAYVAGAVAGDDVRPLAKNLGTADRRVGESLSALLRLAVAIRERGGRTVRRANTISLPVVIECGVSSAVPRATLAGAGRALGCKLRLR